MPVGGARGERPIGQSDGHACAAAAPQKGPGPATFSTGRMAGWRALPALLLFSLQVRRSRGGRTPGAGKGAAGAGVWGREDPGRREGAVPRRAARVGLSRAADGPGKTRVDLSSGSRGETGHLAHSGPLPSRSRREISPRPAQPQAGPRRTGVRQPRQQRAAGGEDGEGGGGAGRRPRRTGNGGLTSPGKRAGGRRQRAGGGPWTRGAGTAGRNFQSSGSGRAGWVHGATAASHVSPEDPGRPQGQRGRDGESGSSSRLGRGPRSWSREAN